MEKSILYCIIATFFYFSLNAQTINEINPNEGMVGEQLMVNISGQETHFDQASSSIYVWFDQASNTTVFPLEIEVESDTKMDVFFDFDNYLEVGFYNVNVYSNIDGFMSLEDGFYMNPNPNLPYIKSIDPDYSYQGDELTVSISASKTHFNQGTITTEVWFSQASKTVIHPFEVSTYNDSVLDATFQFANYHEPGAYDVSVYNAIDGLITLMEGFYLNPDPTPPVLVSVSPNSGAPGETLTVEISGENTNFGQGTNTAEIWFTQGTSTILYPSVVEINSPTNISTVFVFDEEEEIGDYNVNVWAIPDGYLMLENAFSISCIPSAPSIPEGFTELCVGSAPTYYSVAETEDIDQYTWTINPSSAADLSPGPGFNGITATWNLEFEGIAELMVSAVNSCGYGNYSEPLNIEIGTGEVNAGFEYSMDGLELTFTNTSTYADNFEWNFGDNNVGYEIHPFHEYVEDGMYVVQLTAGSDCGVDTYEQSIEVIGNYVSLMGNQSDKIVIAPNPSNGIFNLSFNEKAVETIHIEIFNLSGKLVYTKQLTDSEKKLRINLTEQPEGIYFYKIQGENLQEIGKLIVR